MKDGFSNINDIFSKENILSFSSNKHINKICKIFITTFIPKKKRGFLNDRILYNKILSVKRIWQQIIELYFQDKLEKFEIKPKKIIHSKIIWQYWGQGINYDKLPDVVKMSFNSVDQYKGEYEVIRVNDDNIADYLDLPDFVDQKRLNPEFRHVFFSDLLRLALLQAYGGVWIDATILLTSPIDQKILDQSFFLFQRDHNVKNKMEWRAMSENYFGWENHHVNMLSSFIVSSKNNQITKTCLDLMLNFWKTQNSIPYYFFFQVMFDVLKNNFFKEDELYLLDDTLPHLLQRNLSKKFDLQEYNNILDQINIHKLTYVDIQDEESYYVFLKRSFLYEQKQF